MQEEVGRFAVSFVGNVTKDGYTEYHIKVTNPNGESWILKKRYREVRELHEHLKLKYPDRIPQIPGKRFFFGNHDPVFIRTRQAGLQQYLDSVLKLEPDCRTRALRKFLEIENRHRVPKDPIPDQQQMIEWTQSRFIDLAQTPSSLDGVEIDERILKYSTAMRKHVLNQPVDSIYLQSANVTNAPARFCVCPDDSSAIPVDRVLTEALQKLVLVADTKKNIANPEDLIARFPPLSVGK
eukprot:GEMP01050787.1.p1 GENE.GEMP01050787.1~~GEMP01050787.1.p1  ORF type:complete len:238 (+),score=52.18 GEMP01050787.1:63-776(+)